MQPCVPWRWAWALGGLMASAPASAQTQIEASPTLDPAALVAPVHAAAPVDGREMSLLAQVDEMDRRLVRQEQALEAGEAQVRLGVAALADAESAQAAASLHHSRAQASFARRLTALVRMPDGAQAMALGDSQSLAERIDAERLLAQIAHRDRALWQELESARVALEAHRAAAQAQAQALEAAQVQRRSLRDALAERRRRRQQMLTAHRRTVRREAVALQLKEAARNLSAMVPEAGPGLSASERGLAQAKGSLPWPAQGRVRITFGQRTERLFGTATAHNGWDIAAAAGSQVEAVADGRVAYADWLRGYGQVAIVEHPGGFHTIHAHLARLAVRPGERVRMGQALGTVGDTGSLRGTVLYFEIRHRGAPQDPRLWLAAR